MKAFVTDVRGAVWQLPPARKWELEYGIGTPCDSFYLICPWQMGLETRPEDWVGFHAEHEGERVFTGVVDECEVTLGDRGCQIELSGRGMAALLLDNEALGQDYQLATLEDILRDLPECRVVPISLVCSEEALARRLQGDIDAGIRQPDIMERSIARLPLYDKVATEKVDTSDLTPQQVARLIAKK